MKPISILLLFAISFNWTLGLSPIVIVPGLTASPLEAKVAFPSHFWCNTIGWGRYWASVRLPSCVNRVLKLEYDIKTNTYSNTSGVEMRVPGFGGLESIEYLDELHLLPTYNKFVDFFLKKGYTDKTIRGAPYDWRLAADELKRLGFYNQLQSLIEEMYQVDKEKVTVVAHSMGGPVSLYFFNHVVTQRWKDQYIHAFIPLSGAWSGGNEALPLLLTGFQVQGGILGQIMKEINEAARSLESALWMMPNTHAWGDTVLVTTAIRNYTAYDYKEMFHDIGVEEDYVRLEKILEINGDYPAPNVPIYCFYGTDLNTPETFQYGAGFPDVVPTYLTGDGDGLVNLQSSKICLKWAKEQKAPFSSKAFPGVNHLDMGSDKDVLNAIADIVGVERSADSYYLKEGCTCPPSQHSEL